MNTTFGRLLLIQRDASSADGALTNLHRCLSKIVARTNSLRVKGIGDVDMSIATMKAEEALERATLKLGACLGALDEATAIIEAERKRFLAQRRAERERRLQ